MNKYRPDDISVYHESLRGERALVSLLPFLQTRLTCGEQLLGGEAGCPLPVTLLLGGQRSELGRLLHQRHPVEVVPPEHVLPHAGTQQRQAEGTTGERTP